MAEETEGVRYEEEYITNSRGLKQFTCRWVPENGETRALIFLCHGYAMESSVTMNDAGNRLARAGFGAFGIDYEGHGRSSGLRGFIPSFDAVVDDCSDHFSRISERRENVGKRRFLLGESMGGAVILMLHRKKPGYWDGAVLVAPMCKIADDSRPGPRMTSALTMLCRIIPTWKIIPGNDIVEAAFRDPRKRQTVRENPVFYKGRPRLKSGYELLRASNLIERTLSEVTVPFMVMHGGRDRVTDITVSRKLYETAASRDKSFKTYPDMWHSLTYGETPENIDVVFGDVLSWLEHRVSAGDAVAERQYKQLHDGDSNKNPADS